VPEASPPVAERTWCAVCPIAEKESKKARNTKSVLFFIRFSYKLSEFN
jgi:hypothetical protein